MSTYSCDLHIHSTLSPCGSLEMSPNNIIAKAKEVGLHLISVTDHNMVENSLPTYTIGKKFGITVLFGMEVQTSEEIHLLAFFDNYDLAHTFQDKIYNLLPDIQNDAEYFGDQVVVDEENEIIRFETRLLLNSAQISITDATKWIKDHGGLAIPSHIDSPTFSIISQLGYIPDDLPFDALEVRNKEKIIDLLPLIMKKDIPFVSFSDAHYLKDIGRRRISLDLKKPNCSEIANALKQLL
ncbi:MAG: PHP domain-containing protein [Syntrophorhabdus sp.]|nr:PHP domain-containing protein [Syntrophorhabdus sp.]